jgi:hypothetical protein
VSIGRDHHWSHCKNASSQKHQASCIAGFLDFAFPSASFVSWGCGLKLPPIQNSTHDTFGRAYRFFRDKNQIVSLITVCRLRNFNKKIADPQITRIARKNELQRNFLKWTTRRRGNPEAETDLMQK